MQSCIKGDTISSRLGGRTPPKKTQSRGGWVASAAASALQHHPAGPISLTRKGRTLCRSFVDSRSEFPRFVSAWCSGIVVYSTPSNRCANPALVHGLET